MHGLLITVAALVGVSCLLSTTGVAAERHRVRGAVKARDAVRWVRFDSGFGARERKSGVLDHCLNLPHCFVASGLHPLTQSLFLTCCSILRYETGDQTRKRLSVLPMFHKLSKRHGRTERFVRWIPLQVPHTLVLFLSNRWPAMKPEPASFRRHPRMYVRVTTGAPFEAKHRPSHTIDSFSHDVSHCCYNRARKALTIGTRRRRTGTRLPLTGIRLCRISTELRNGSVSKTS